MKTAKSLSLLLVLLFSWAGAGNARNVWTHFPDVVNSNSVTVELIPDGEVPELMAVIVQTNDPMDAWEMNRRLAMERWRSELATNHNARPAMPPAPPPPSSNNYFDHAKWLPFKTNLLVDLGTGDGKRELLFSFRYQGQARGDGWGGAGITVQHQAPFIGITYPKPATITQPVICLKGFSSANLGPPVQYEVLNQNGITTTKGEGLLNDRYYDMSQRTFTTNYFTCYYIQLSPGTNTISLRCEDDAGNQTFTNFIYVLDLGQDKTPPVISIDWPQPGMEIDAGPCTVRGKLDDNNERMVGQIIANGQTSTVNGEVEWSQFIDGAGYFWVERLPISIGTNCLMLTATDAAGNSSSTNLTLIGVEGPTITMDPVVPAVELWQPYIDVTGKVSPANNDVWINGVKAVVKPDGTWLAKHVPVVSPNVGTACFDMTSVPPEGKTNGSAKQSQALSSQASLGTNAMVLNASYPACGVFRLHLSGTAGRSFVLQASTNLVAWMPILTNSSPDATFDFTDTNANNYPCRFFKVVPVQ